MFIARQCLQVRVAITELFHPHGSSNAGGGTFHLFRAGSAEHQCNSSYGLELKFGVMRPAAVRDA